MNKAVEPFQCGQDLQDIAASKLAAYVKCFFGTKIKCMTDMPVNRLKAVIFVTAEKGRTEVNAYNAADRDYMLYLLVGKIAFLSIWVVNNAAAGMACDKGLFGKRGHLPEAFVGEV